MKNHDLGQFLNRIVTDPEFREHFERDRAAVIRELSVPDSQIAPLRELDVERLVKESTSVEGAFLSGAHVGSVKPT